MKNIGHKQENMKKNFEEKNDKTFDNKFTKNSDKNFNKSKSNIKTSWGNVAESYDKYLASDKNYHSEVVVPNLLRMILNSSKTEKESKDKNENKILENKNILDIACGQGLISEEIKKINKDVNIYAFDAGENLIKIAKENIKKNKTNIKYFIADAQNFVEDIKIEESKINKDVRENNISNIKFDIIICVLAIQNIENVKLVLENIKKVSNKNTKIYFVINHPAYRIPKYTQWGYSTEAGSNIQYRRVDKYMSEDKIKMDMNPGEKKENKKEWTYSYHRPIQYYFKLFNNNNFVVSRLEEWISNRNSEGKNAERENKARKEFPMFMCLEVKID